MVYREVHVIEIKEILTRLANGHSIRSISNSLGIHRDTIRNYCSLALGFGFDKNNKNSITDDLVSKVRQSLFSTNKTDRVRLPETDPGQYAQADFGYLGKIFDSDKERKVHALVVTLCHSRHMFVYITFKQDTSAVIAGFE